MGIFDRTERLLGAQGMRQLTDSHVLLFGVGGVGSYVAEGLVRSGLGAITIVDGDRVAESNLNRQSHATTQTIGMPKTQAMAERLHAINPACRVTACQHFYLPDDTGGIWEGTYDYCADAVDNVTAKLDIAVQCQARGIPLLSAMGTGNKLDPTAFVVADIYETDVCPLCRVMRRELRKRGIPSLRVVYSREVPIVPNAGSDPPAAAGRPIPGSVAFVPSVAGLIMAGEIIRALAGPPHKAPSDGAETHIN